MAPCACFGNSPTNFIDPSGLIDVPNNPTAGNGQVQADGQDAHRHFGKGTKRDLGGGKGPITDRLEIKGNDVPVNELKPKTRLQNPSKFKQAEKQVTRQMEAAQSLHPTMNVRGRLWQWTKDAAGNFKCVVVQRYKFVRQKGGKWVAKRVPVLGTIVTISTWAQDCEA